MLKDKQTPALKELTIYFIEHSAIPSADILLKTARTVFNLIKKLNYKGLVDYCFDEINFELLETAFLGVVRFNSGDILEMDDVPNILESFQISAIEKINLSGTASNRLSIISGSLLENAIEVICSFDPFEKSIKLAHERTEQLTNVLDKVDLFM